MENFDEAGQILFPERQCPIVAQMDEVRTAAAELVAREEYRTRSRMLAYENVASMVGMSSSWLRQFIHGYGEAHLLYPVALNIKAIYDRVCYRVEQDTLVRNQRMEVINAARARTVEQSESPHSGMENAPDHYDSADDITRSFEEVYRAIRERVKAGGPGWEPK